MSALEFIVGSAVLVLPRGNLALLAGATAVKGAGARCCFIAAARPPPAVFASLLALDGHITCVHVGIALHSSVFVLAAAHPPPPQSQNAGALIKHARSRRSGGSAASDRDESDESHHLLLPGMRSPSPSGGGGAGTAAGGVTGRPKTPSYDTTSVPPVTLEWAGLGYNLVTKGGATEKVLQGVEGAAQPGRLLAIM